MFTPSCGFKTFIRPHTKLQGNKFDTQSPESYYTKHRMSKITENNFAWYLDITPNQMFSLYEYPVPGKNGLPLCEEHGKQLELKEVVLFDKMATEAQPPDHCWVCKE